MEEDMILQPISMDTEQDTRSAWKTSGLFSNNGKEALCDRL